MHGHRWMCRRSRCRGRLRSSDAVGGRAGLFRQLIIHHAHQRVIWIGQPLSQSFDHKWRHDSGQSLEWSAKRCDLFDQAGAGVSIHFARHYEHRFDVRNCAVGDGDLTFICNVAGVADAAHDGDRVHLPGKVNGKAHVMFDPHPTAVGFGCEHLVDERLRDLQAFLIAEHGLLGRIVPDGNADLIKHPPSAANDIKVPQRDGVKRAGIDRKVMVLMMSAHACMIGTAEAAQSLFLMIERYMR